MKHRLEFIKISGVIYALIGFGAGIVSKDFLGLGTTCVFGAIVYVYSSVLEKSLQKYHKKEKENEKNIKRQL